jgi:hypothetical protein
MPDRPRRSRFSSPPSSVGEVARGRPGEQQADRQRQKGRREGWLAEAIEGNFSDEERKTLEEAVQLIARLAEL